MTHLTCVRIRNFMRYRGEHEVSLEAGIYALVAQHVDDEARSNFTGKSSFVGAVRWCLEGCTVCDAAVLDDMVSHGEDEMEVEIELSDGTYVSRLKPRGKSTQLLLAHPDGRELQQEGAQEELDRIIGMQKGDRLSTCWCEQGEVDALVTMSPTTLTQTVERWLGLERLSGAADLVNDCFRKIGVQLTEANVEIKRLEATSTHTVEQLEEMIEGELTSVRQRAELIRQAQEANVRFNDRKIKTGLLDERVELNGLIAEKVKSISLLGEAAVSDEQTEAHAKACTEEVLGRRKVQDLRNVQGKGFDGKCPVSPGFDCPAKQQIHDRGAINRQALERAIQAQGALTERVQITAKPIADAADTYEQVLRETGALNQLRDRLGQVIKRLDSQLFAGLLKLEPDEFPPPIPEPYDRTNQTLAERELKSLQDALLQLPEARERVVRLSREQRVLKAASFILGPEGAGKRASMRAVLQIQTDANQLLRQAGIGLSVEAVWDRETGKLAEQCGECGASYPSSQKVKTCASCGVVRGPKLKHEFGWRLSDVSGAAKDLVGLALRCAAFRRLRSSNGTVWSLAVFDEPLHYMDAPHRKAIGTHLQQLLGHTFEQAIVSSHDTGFVDSLPKRIVVTGDGKWSNVKVVE